MVNSFRDSRATDDETRFGQAFLDDIVVWISETLNPDEVFENANLVDWISDNYAPEELFDDDELGDWAINNGFVEQGEKA